jgi:hypothetical protein
MAPDRSLARLVVKAPRLAALKGRPKSVESLTATSSTSTSRRCVEAGRIVAAPLHDDVSSPTYIHLQ